MSVDRQLPNVLDVEGVIISTCLQLGMNAIDACAEAGLLETDFYNTENKEVYRILLLMRSLRKPFDPILLDAELKRLSVFEDNKSAEYIANAINIASCVIKNIPAHCKIIQEAAKRRQIIETYLSIVDAAYDDKNDLEKLEKLFNEEAIKFKSSVKTFPSPVWGRLYNEKGFPELKPELISGVLRQSHKLLIGAPSKACKSFLAIRLALSIATGSNWLGFPCKKSNVYYINFEIDEGSFMHRAKAVAAAMGIAFPDNILFHHLRGEGADIEILFPRLAWECDGKDFSAIILDPQYKLLRSSRITQFSENDSSAMAYLYGELDRHFVKNNISPIIISHFAKGSATAKDQIDRIAGSGLLARDVDALFTLSAIDTPGCFRGEFSLREFQAPEPISLQWTYPLHQIDATLDNVPLKRSGRSQGVSKSADDDLVLKTIQELDDWVNQSAIVAKLAGSVSKNRVLNALQRLVTSGKLIFKRGEKNSALYNTS